MMTAVCPRCEYVGDISMDGEWDDHTQKDCDERLARRGQSGAFTVKCRCYYHTLDGKCTDHTGMPITEDLPKSASKSR